MPRLNEHSHHEAIGMLRAGASVRQVAGAFGVHYSTVYRLQQRQQMTGTVADRPRAGAPRVTTPRQDRAIRRQHLQDWFQTAASTSRATQGQRGGPISSRTVRRQLADANIRCRRPFRGPILTDRHSRERRVWASWVVARLGGTSCSPTNPDFVSVIKMAESKCTEATGMAVYCKETVMAEHQSWSGGQSIPTSDLA